MFSFAQYNFHQNQYSMTVCIAEKPSVAAEIAKVLGARSKKDGYYEGNGYQVTWTFGHLCQLKQPDGYYGSWKKWDMAILPMVPPKFEVELIQDAGVKKQFKVIKDLYKAADLIVNCGDAGQEGELIQRWVMELAGVRCPVKRLWISSLTEESIRQGFQSLCDQTDYDRLFMAGQARAEGDWLLGMNATRLYTLKYGGYKQVLSIGRVQTPTLSMIVDRDREIEHFIPKPYWVLTTKYRDTTFTCTKARFETSEEGEQCLQSANRYHLTVKDVQKKKGSEQPPQLYDLTSLQVDCNRKYGFSADTTLKCIQSLYEKKLTTYPRVDTKYLTDDIFEKCPSIIHSLTTICAGARSLDGLALEKSRRVFDNSKVTDHHAIIPTGDVRGLASLNQQEMKVFGLIVRRFVAVFCPPCEYAQTTILAVAGDVEFKATGRTILSEGWRMVYAGVRDELQEDDDASKEDDANDVLPEFTVGESGPHIPSLTQKMTTPPKRFTEASLLQAMETAGKLVDDETLRDAMKENGIGRPSSRAGIIETLLKRGYIRREKKNLVSNPAGRDLMDVIHAKMLRSPELTGLWEKKLRDIEHGRFSLEAFMDELQAQLVSIIKEVQADTSDKKISSQSEPAPKAASSRKSSSGNSAKKVKVGDLCPVCGKGYVRKGPYGLFCSEYKNNGCKFKQK
jgi:DNA topoisomerase-3